MILTTKLLLSYTLLAFFQWPFETEAFLTVKPIEGLHQQDRSYVSRYHDHGNMQQSSTSTRISSTVSKRYHCRLTAASTSSPNESITSTSTSTSTSTKISASASSMKNDVWSVIQFAFFSLALAVAVITWEDITCHSALPSRHRTTYISDAHLSWGQATIRGMGFGKQERLLLIQQAQDGQSDNNSNNNNNNDDNNLSNLRSYNEVLQDHWQIRVPQWRQDAAVVDDQKNNNPLLSTSAPADYYATAIHTLCQCLASLDNELKHNIENYQWPRLRQTLHTAPWSELEWAASRLRKVDNAVGFDWGSCAWRGHNACNALADAQEAIDELDYLSGVLEPYEALFCVDIIERSLRDMLVAAPWQWARPEDAQYWQTTMDTYVPHRVFDPEQEEDEDGGQSERIDDEYLKTLQDLKVDDDS